MTVKLLTEHHLEFLIFKNILFYEISNYVACATSKGSEQPAARMCSLIRAFASHLNIKLLTEQHLEFPGVGGGCTKARLSLHCMLPLIYTVKPILSGHSK